MSDSFHIRRNDGRYLTGPGSTETGDGPRYPYSRAAAQAAIKRYQLVGAVYCPDLVKGHTFTLTPAN